jgi:bifunctional DNA-binding transcriptional regulator/antitoxin component of YhaV-PrlF toxin-antitoxin module
MKRKLVQAGGSLAVTLPSEVVRGLKLRRGQEVDVTVHPTSGAVIVRAGVLLHEGGSVTPTFEKRVADLVGKRAKLFRALAK